MERQEFLQFLHNDLWENKAIVNYVLLEKAFNLANTLKDETQSDIVSDLAEAYESTLEEENAYIFFDEDWHNVEDFLTEYYPKDDGDFKIEKTPFDLMFKGVSLLKDTHKFYDKVEEELIDLNKNK